MEASLERFVPTLRPLLPLQPDEALRLRECEAVIDAGLASFIRVGAALMEIRNKRYFRVTHPTFESYCDERYGLRRGRAYELMAGFQVVANLSSIGVQAADLPANERQARELVPYEPEAQAALWAIIKATAPEGKVTSGHIRSVAIVVKEIAVEGALDDGSGEVKPFAQLLTAAVTEQTYERLQRQKAHVADAQSDSDEWYTAEGPFLVGVRAVLGQIDLDPFSCEAANEVIKAKKIFTRKENGLKQPWAGRVYANPPFSNPAPCVAKAIGEYDAERTQATILLLNNQTDSGWCQVLLKRFPVCFPHSRIPFWRVGREGTGGARQGQVVSYFGSDEALFIRTFQSIGTVMRAIQI